MRSADYPIHRDFTIGKGHYPCSPVAFRRWVVTMSLRNFPHIGDEPMLFYTLTMAEFLPYLYEILEIAEYPHPRGRE